MQNYNAIDLEPGKRFGRWVVIERDGTNRFNEVMYLCVCDCGTERRVRSSALRKGMSASCGCVQAEKAVGNRYAERHGHAPRGEKSREYRLWDEIVQRCCNPGSKAYPHYGGRGVQLCDRWREDFTAFLEDLGEAPSADHTIELVDPEGDYEPGNARWGIPFRGPRPPKRRRRQVGQQWFWRGKWRPG